MLFRMVSRGVSLDCLKNKTFRINCEYYMRHIVFHTFPLASVLLFEPRNRNPVLQVIFVMHSYERYYSGAFVFGFFKRILCRMVWQGVSLNVLKIKLSELIVNIICGISSSGRIPCHPSVLLFETRNRNPVLQVIFVMHSYGRYYSGAFVFGFFKRIFRTTLLALFS